MSRGLWRSRYAWVVVCFGVACDSGGDPDRSFIESVSPSYCGATGGESVEVEGQWSLQWTAVEMRDPVSGISEATGTNLVSAQDTLQVTLPAHAGGLVNLALVNGSSYLLTPFVYDPAAWPAFGPDAAQSGLNKDAARFVTTARAAGTGSDGGQIVVWREDNGTATQLRAAKLASDGTRTWLDGGGASGLNRDPAMSIEKPAVLRDAFWVGGVYAFRTAVAWTERHPTRNTYQVRVKLWNGETATPVWQSIDGDGADGLNGNPAFDADDVQLGVVRNELTAVWIESTATSIGRVRYAKLEAHATQPTWTYFSGGNSDGSTWSSAESAYGARLQGFFSGVSSDEAHVAWIETGNGVGHVRVARRDSDTATTWRYLDGNSANGLNLDPTKDAASCTLFSSDDALYCAWTEADGSGVYQLRLARWNSSLTAPTWTFVGGSATTGLNFSGSATAANPSGVFLGSRLYLAWRETSGVNKYLRVAGITDSARTIVGTGGAGINDTTGNDNLSVQAFVADNQLHLVRTQENSTGVYQVRVAKGN